MRVISRTLIAIVLAGAPRTAAAHHGIVNFDMNAELEVTGVVTRLAFVNPHSWLYFDVTGGDGGVAGWRCELRGATVLRRSGWTPEMFAPGTRITITGAPDRFAPNTCYLGTVVFANGTRIDRYGQIIRSTPPAAAGARPLRLPNGQPQDRGGVGGRTARADGSARHQRSFPAAQRRASARFGCRSRRRPGLSGHARHRRFAGGGSDRRVLESPAERHAAD